MMRWFTGIALFCVWAALWGTTGCANIAAPSGGPRDTLPPKLLKATPDNDTRQFKSGTITLQFDEYVELENVMEKLIVNPTPERMPQVDRKLRTVTVRIKDTLEPNTTYSLKFDGVIKDLNEGNPLGDYTYVFSTGNTIDTLSVVGSVIMAETGKVDSTLIVILHKNLTDSAVVKDKPRYLTRLDNKGRFRFDYLAPGTYNIFALKDNGFRRYSDSSQVFAFYDKPVAVGAEPVEPVELLAFVAKEESAKSPGSDRAAPAQGLGMAGRGKDREEAEKRFTVRTSAASGDQDLLSDLKLTFSKPFATFDSTQLFLTDTLEKSVGPFTLQPDSTATEISLKHRWKDNFHYRLLIARGFATDSAGNALSRADTVFFKTKAESEYGSVKLTITDLDLRKNPVLQWVQGSEVVRSVPLTNNTFTDRLFKPGEYTIRILLDANRNGVWDTGDYWTRRQPERVIAVTQKFNVRQNWDNEYEVSLSATPDAGAGDD